ncbi:phosphoribosyltransferase domain-containing protein [Pelagibacterales bacterium SAG-MED13]|nr:phosphoribosyltransferase domain-containing protein [Pelagibacterales bacterium SAG-MED13]|tara:strand:- start:542 stop:1063 length:522 start_codon:yes stop_codon:yes gene_type:complete
MSKKMIVGWEEYKKIVEKLAIEIHKSYKPTVLIGIMRGAAPIIDILSRILKLPIAYIVIQSYSGKGTEDQQGKLMFAREISSLANDKDFTKVLLIDDLSDTGLTLNKSIEWLKNYGPTKEYIKEVKTACLWKKKSSKFEPDFCSIRLNSDPWIVQPTEHYEELSIEEISRQNK